MARASSGTQVSLDLSNAAADAVTKQVKAIRDAYDDDFCVVPTAAPPEIIHTGSLAVQVAVPVLDENSYKEQLAAWNQDVEAWTSKLLEDFVQSQVHIVVDDQTDVTRLRRKVENLSLIKEKKRKLFLHDECVTTAVDWPKLKRRRLSMFTSPTHTITPEDLDPITEVYAIGKTAGPTGGDSEDILMVVVPGPPPNAPGTKNVATVHSVLKNISPKLQSPKIGKIEISTVDILRRSKKHRAFTGTNENNIVFSMQAKGPMHKGDGPMPAGVYFNKWTVPGIQMA